MAKTYYKVVSFSMESALSCFVGEYNIKYDPTDVGYKDFMLEYKLNNWVYPKLNGSRLYAFNDIKYASDFISKIREHDVTCRLFECEVKNPKKIKQIPSMFHNIKKYWNNRRKHKKNKIGMNNNPYISNGTVSCDAIKLTKEIYLCQ